MFSNKLRGKDLAGKTIGFFGSGGLDSQTIVSWLTSLGVRVIVFIIDVGQPDEKDVNDIPPRMKKAGAVEVIVVNGKEVLAEYMMLVIQALASYEGGYMNTTGIARMAKVKAAMPEILSREIEVMAHGATGRGNDQVRFELALSMLAPQIQVYAPWRDEDFLAKFGGRREMIAYCQSQGLDIVATEEKPYSTDANFCGLTHEAGKLESLETPTDFVRFVMGVSPQEAPEEGKKVSISFNQGRPLHLNGVRVSLLEIFQLLNIVAGQHGIGIGIDQVENRRVGIKSRGVYESPGVTLLASAYEKLVQLVLDRNARKNFDDVSRKFAEIVYYGELFSPGSEDLLAIIKNIAKRMTGTIELFLYKGNIRFLSARDVKHSLYNAEASSMENVGNFDHRSAQGYVEIANVLARAQAASGQVTKSPGK